LSRVKLVSLGFWLMLVAGFLAPVHALELGISPPEIQIRVAPGDTYRGEIIVFGSDIEPVDVLLSKTDWSLTTSGDYLMLPMGTVKRSASSWVSLASSQFRLPPKQGRRVQYTIKAPPNISGSYWTGIMFSTVSAPVSSKEKQVQIGMAGRIVCSVKIDVDGSLPRGNVERMRLKWDGESKKILAGLRVKNNGDSFIRFKGRLEVRDSQGRIANALPFEEGLVLPDSAREFSLKDYDFQFKPGFYVALAIADLGDKSQKAVQGTLEIK
jgi:hypothetical protein